MKPKEVRIVQAENVKLRFIPFEDGIAALDSISTDGHSAFTNITKPQGTELRNTLTEWLGDGQSFTDGQVLKDFIAETERALFRTEHDIGGNVNARIVWNRVRALAGLPALREEDLTTADEYCDRTCDVISEREYPLMPRSQSPYLRSRKS